MKDYLKLNIYETFAKQMSSTSKTVKYGQDISCTNDYSQQTQLIDLLLREYNTGVLTHLVGCCPFPHVSSLPYVWRAQLGPITAFLNLARTGLRAYVQDTHNKPMLNATVQIIDDKIRDVKPPKALFKMILPAGKYKLIVSCHQYETKMVNVEIKQDNMLDLIVRLNKSSVLDSSVVPEVVSGIKGYVIDELNHPIANAMITVEGDGKVKAMSDDKGRYGLELGPGRHSVNVQAKGYESRVQLVIIPDIPVVPQQVMFRLIRDTHIWGLPRSLFLALAGKYSNNKYKNIFISN